MIGQDAREACCNAMLERTSGKSFAAMRLKPVVSEWKDAVSDALSRRGVLHCLLSGIMGGWNRRFRKNHFLAWKFHSKQILNVCEAKSAAVNTQVLVDAFACWAAAPHVTAQEAREAQMKDKLVSFAEQLKASQKALYEAQQLKLALESEAQAQLETAIREKDLKLETAIREKELKLQEQLSQKQRALADRDTALKILRDEKEGAEDALKAQVIATAEAQASSSHLLSQAKIAQDLLKLQLDEVSNKVQNLQEKLQKSVEEGNAAVKLHGKEVQALREEHESEMKQLSSTRQQQIDSLNSLLKEHEVGRKTSWANQQELTQKVENLTKELRQKEEEAVAERGKGEEKVRQLLKEIEKLHAVEVDMKVRTAQQADAQARVAADLETVKKSEASKTSEIASLQYQLAQLQGMREDEKTELERELSELKTALVQQSDALHAKVSSLQAREIHLQGEVEKAKTDLRDRLAACQRLEEDLRQQLAGRDAALSTLQATSGEELRVLAERAAARLKEEQDKHEKAMEEAADSQRRYVW